MIVNIIKNSFKYLAHSELDNTNFLFFFLLNFLIKIILIHLLSIFEIHLHNNSIAVFNLSSFFINDTKIFIK